MFVDVLMCETNYGLAVPCQVTQAQKSDTASEYDMAAPVNTEGQQYVDCRSYIKLEIALTRPLVPKRPPEELARKCVESRI